MTTLTPASQAVHAEFHYEYQQELNTILRTRFSWWVASWAVFWLWFIVFGGHWVAGVFAWVICGAGWWASRQRVQTIEQLRRLAFWMLVGCGLAAVVVGPLLDGTAQLVFFSLVFSHFLVCLILPLTIGQAVPSAVALGLLWTVGDLLFGEGQTGWWFIVEVLVRGMFFGLGLVVTVLRESILGRRIEHTLLQRFRDEYSREIFDAQKVHAALFPEAQTEGPIRFQYRDTARAGIGGDFLHAHFSEDANAMNLIVMDVLGDGIAAALTVNRIQGQVERLYAEFPDILPDELITRLNRYVYLTLSPYGVYVATICMRVTKTGEVCWAGAGHTPAYIRHADGTFEELESTTWWLGADENVEPGHTLLHTTMTPADVLIAHTDGANSLFDKTGRVLGLNGVRSIIGSSEAPEDALEWPDYFFRGLMARTENHWPPSEDVLVVSAAINGEAIDGGGSDG